jgi:hypothetical protein
MTVAKMIVQKQRMKTFNKVEVTDADEIANRNIET